MAYSGKFSPKNKQKYKGDVNNITYRSLWELKFMMFCDDNPSILEYASEEIVIPYFSPIDKKMHRYFVDFWVKLRDKDGNIKTYLVEIKPHKQCLPPTPPKSGKNTKKFLKESMTYEVNQSKWKAAKKFCEEHDMEFIVMTEKTLKPYEKKS